MSFATTTDLQSLRERVHSLENRLLSFERTSILLLTDINDRMTVTDRPTPAALVATLRAQYPELETHPTLWQDIEQLLGHRWLA